MPGPVETIRLMSPQGVASDVPVDEVAQALDNGFRLEAPGEFTSRIDAQVVDERNAGAFNTIKAGAAGLARGATMGLSDAVIAGVGTAGMTQGLRELRDTHPIVSGATELVGAVAPAFFGETAGLGGAIARATPAGRVAGIGAQIAERGVGRGIVARAGFTTAAGAAEGGLAGGGNYISDVALEDKPLSAEAFVGAMGHGALWGGATGGALSLGSSTLTNARRLFPKQQITRAAAEEAEHAVATEVTSALRDGDNMRAIARDRLREIRVKRAEADLATKAELDRIKVDAARAMADQKIAARATKTKRVFATAEPEVAAAARSGATPATDLEATLAATKRGLDEGKTLGQLSARDPRSIEDAMNAVIAKADPEAAALVKAEKTARMTREEVDAWIAKQKAPAEEARGTARSHVESGSGAPARGIGPRKLDRIETPIEEGARGLERTASFYEREAGRPTLAEQILSSGKPPGGSSWSAEEILDISAQQRGERAKMAEMAAKIRGSLRGKSDDVEASVAEAADIIGRHEAAEAELAQVLGVRAPPGASRRAAEYGAAADAQRGKVIAGTAQASQEAERKLATPGVPEAALPGAASGTEKRRLLGRLADVGAGLEVLRALGIAVPDPGNLPVVGPLLSLYLKARAANAAFRRLGGKMPATAESVIASKAAVVRQRGIAAIDRVLSGAATITKAAETRAPIAAALGATLFDDSVPSAPARRRPKETRIAAPSDLQVAYRARLAELARATAPGAVRAAIERRIGASDPTLVASIANVEERKLAFLDSKAPKPDRPASPLGGDEWGPSPAALARWARYLDAAHDPAGVLERLADHGEITPEAAETLRVVYPELYAEARNRLFEVVERDPETLPYVRRVQLSVLFDAALDPSMDPAYVRFLQEGYATPATPAAVPAGAAPPSTGLAADVMLGTRTMTALDQRAGA